MTFIYKMRDHRTVMSYLKSNHILFLYCIQDIHCTNSWSDFKTCCATWLRLCGYKMDLEIIPDISSLVILKEPYINSYKKRRAAGSVLESQILFLKIVALFKRFFPVHKLSLLLYGLPATMLEQLFVLLLMLKPTVFYFPFSRAWLCFGVCLSQLEEDRKGEIRPLYWACHREFVLLPGIVLGAPWCQDMGQCVFCSLQRRMFYWLVNSSRAGLFCNFVMCNKSRKNVNFLYRKYVVF